jgi:hypothetical protein
MCDLVSTLSNGWDVIEGFKLIVSLPRLHTRNSSHHLDQLRAAHGVDLDY